jgi:streptomycin 6-kinase
MFLNPDLAVPSHPIATDHSRFLRRLDVVSKVADLERRRLLRWILAWSGLSGVWSRDDVEAASTALAIAQFAAAEIDR